LIDHATQTRHEDLGHQPVEDGEQEDQIDDLTEPVLELELRQAATAVTVRGFGRGVRVRDGDRMGRVVSHCGLSGYGHLSPDV
jgi:hypothetical protein